MSELIETMRNKPNFYAEKGVPMIQIEQAEKILGLKFAPDFKECLCEFGAVSIDGHEFTGFSADPNLYVVKVTQDNWKKNNVKKNLYVIEEAHIDGIVIWQDADGTVYETTPKSEAKKIACSLAEYIGAVTLMNEES